MSQMLPELRRAGYLSALDEQFARTVAGIAGETRPEVLLAAALASRQVSCGHVCLDVARAAAAGAPVDEEGDRLTEVDWPRAEDVGGWLDALRESPLVAEASSALDGARPLVLDGNGRLYLHRYWDHQRRVARALRDRALAVEEDGDPQAVRAALDRLFPREPGGGLDWQRVAAAVALDRRLCVISGGPGTGKTHTVLKILALLVERARARDPGARLHVHLLAPTGKAAARLGEAIHKAKPALACSDEIKDAIPSEASTIHRCLGSIRQSDTRFRHHAENPLLADVVLVDEASMVDLALLARLTDALPPSARLVLLGDKDQLASVEAGAVLGDICNSGAERAYSPAFLRRIEALLGEKIPQRGTMRSAVNTGIGDSIVELTRSYRYGAESGIGRLARAINAGDAAMAAELLDAGLPDVARIEPVGDRALPPRLRDEAAAAFSPLCGERDPERGLAALEHYRILAAHRRGRAGVERLNREIEEALESAGLLASRSPFYPGRPLLVTENDYRVGLFNGDIGLVVGEGPRSAPCFIGAAGELRRIAPSRLPPHETAFAMTVHRSQGSEFDEIAVVLPDAESPVVTRELLYTAVTRARRKVTVCAKREVVERAVRTPIERASGLRDELYG